MAVVKSRIASPKSILAIKFSSIGDIVLTTSPLQSLQDAFPDSKIDVITLREFTSLLEGVAFINKIIPFDRQANFRQLIRTGKWINNSKYDLVIDFHNSLRSKIILSIIKSIPTRILIKPRWKRFLIFRFRKNRFEKDFNQIKLLHSPISNLISSNTKPLPKLYVSDIEKNDADQLLRKNGLKNDYIAVIPGAAWSQKVWSAEKYNSLFQKIKTISNYDFVILGTDNDNICTEISNLNSSIINLAGKTSIRESMAIIANSCISIGADTGFIHAAEALGKDVVMIMGPTSVETGAGVNRESSINIENNDIWCRPCSQNGSRKCYRSEQYCMTTIKDDFVFSNVQGLLA